MTTPIGFLAYVRLNPECDLPGATIRCSRCKEQRPPESFYLPRARRVYRETGALRDLATCCRECNRDKAYRYKAEKLALMRAAKAVGCADCGLVNLAHPEIFDFDHAGGEKVKGVADWLTCGTVEDLLAEMARCEVVCSNCHRIRTARRPHGLAASDLRPQ